MKFQKYDTVRTVPVLLDHSFLVPLANQKVRRPDSPGFVVSYTRASNGLNVLVRHENETTFAVYEEIELVEERNAYWKITYAWSGIMCYKELARYDEIADYVEKNTLGDITIEGPFFETKTLQEGPLETKTLFDHLTEDL